MNLCIDTCAYVAFKKGNSSVISILEAARTLMIPTTVLGELYAGFYTGSRTSRNITELHEFLDQPDINIKGPGNDIADRYGIIVKELRQKGSPIPTNDIWIAATALETGARLLTFDKHFEHIPGLIIIYPM
ncbi:MAG TPA: type II toxin-antitoxin system VapC family toxin [Chitinispirillaceae bacterium]|nr:type II toxin-antitoxin system VapC family toxin [Chitinispirillaceae bacterium]